MNLKEQIKIGWPFIAAAIIFILLVIFSTSGVYNVSDILFGAAYILLAITVTYTCNKAAKRFQKNGKYESCARLLYGAGLLTGLWLCEAIEYLF
jgi:4-amino-4-deoxy-L-arabinose transferase-like glycosyltransferase